MPYEVPPLIRGLRKEKDNLLSRMIIEKYLYFNINQFIN